MPGPERVLLQGGGSLQQIGCLLQPTPLGVLGAEIVQCHRDLPCVGLPLENLQRFQVEPLCFLVLFQPV